MKNIAHKYETGVWNLKTSLLIGLLLLVLQATAGVETFTERAVSADLNSGLLLETYDDKYSIMDADPTWVNDFANKKIINRIIFSIDEGATAYQASDYVAEIELLITYQTYVGGSFQTTTFNKTLKVDFKTTGPYKGKAIHEFEGGNYLKVEFINANTSLTNFNLALEAEIEVERYYTFDPTAIPSNLSSNFLANRCELELSWLPQDGAEAYDLEWLHINNYDGNGGVFPASAIDLENRIFDYNSTRVTISSNNYNIPLLYEQGYILYRIRGIGRTAADNFEKDLAAAWTSDNSSWTTVSGFPHQYLINAHEPKLNWQSTTTFIENGKRKSVASYADGSLRSRQEVSQLNTEDKVIIGETIYDHQGRPTVQILPVPADKQKLEYSPNFNLNLNGMPYIKENFDLDGTDCVTPAEALATSSGASNYYSPDNPDKDGHQAYLPNANGYPLTQVTYTPDNTGRVQAQSGVGDTHQIGTGHETQYFYGKPFQEELDRFFGNEVGQGIHYKKNLVKDPNGQVTVSYMDPQGRTIATGLAGNAPQGLETLPSANPSSMNVDLLNNNTENIPDYDNGTLTLSRELLVAVEGQYDFEYENQGEKYEYECSVELDLPDGSVITVEDNLCFDCVFDLDISLTDNCDKEYLQGIASGSTNLTIGADVLDEIRNNPNYDPSDCNTTPPSLDPVSWSSNTDGQIVPLAVGSYSLVKKLTLNQEALDFYTRNYLDSNECVLGYDYFLEQEIAAIDTSGCNIDCDECADLLGSYDQYNSMVTPDCDPCYTQAEYDLLLEECFENCEENSVNCIAALSMLLADVSPMGQYGLYMPGNTLVDSAIVAPTPQNISPEDYPLSIFNTSNYLPRDLGLPTPNWRNPYNLEQGNPTHYYDGFGLIALVELSPDNSNFIPSVQAANLGQVNLVNGTYTVEPQYLENLTDFLASWEPTWANSLVAYHPEYCYYEFCLGMTDSHNFDDDWINTLTFSEAQTAFGADLQNPINIDPYFTSANLNYYPSGGTMVLQIRNAMINAMQDFEPGGLSMIEMAEATANCPDYDGNVCSVPCTFNGINTDKEWEAFKSFYISTKQTIQEKHRVEYAIDKTCYNGCIGNESFNPFDYGFYQSSYSTSGSGPWWWGFWNSQYFNFRQTCSWYTKRFYPDKTPRFPLTQYQSTSTNANSNLNYCQDPSNPYGTIQCPEQNEAIIDELQAQADIAIYENCGKCPQAFQLEQFLNGMTDVVNNTQLLQATSLNLSCNNNVIPEFNATLVDGLGFTSNNAISWNYSPAESTPKHLVAYFNNQSGEACQMQLKIPDTLNYDIIDIEKFCCIKYTTNPSAFPVTGANNFLIKATVIIDPADADYDLNDPTATKNIIIEGVSDCLDVGVCEFDPVCTPTPAAMGLQNLLNATFAENANFPLDLNQLPYEVFIFDELQEHFQGDSTTNYTLFETNCGTPAPILTTVNAAIANRSITANGICCDIVVDYGSYTPSDVSSLLNLRPNPLGSDYDFLVTALVNDPSGPIYAEISGTTTCLIMRNCVEVEIDLPVDPDALNLQAGVAFTTQNGYSNNAKVLTSFSVQSPQTNAVHNQNWAPAQYTHPDWTRGNLGSIFGMTHDREAYPNIYVTSSSVYTSDYFPAGAGAIFKIDGATGEITNGGAPWALLPNSSSGLGNISYDRIHNQFFVTNMEDGKIYRLSASGAVLSTFDPFVQNTTAINGFAPLRERLFAVSYHQDRVYFSLWSNDKQNYSNGTYNKIYSVALDANGEFIGAEQEEIQIPYYNPLDSRLFSSPVATITFKDNGNMLLAERTMTGASYTAAHSARILEYVPNGTSWAPTNNDYFIGEALEGHNATGGIDITNDGYLIAMGDGLEYDLASPFLVFGMAFIPESGNNFVGVNDFNYNVDLDGNTSNFSKSDMGNVLVVNEVSTADQIAGGFCDFSVDFTVEIVDDCAENLLLLAATNATTHYEDYIEDIRKGFQEDYIRKCLDVYENFEVTYTDAEHHFTLYYYDQGGNLVRTVPPEGVAKITDANDLAQIEADRSNGARNFFTDHSYTTTYKYNSLNQLVYQNMPDHENLDIFEVLDRNNGISSSHDVYSTTFVDENQGLAFAKDNQSNGHIYKTVNGGQDWTKTNALGWPTLNAVQYTSSTEVYAVGNNGIIIFSDDSGVTWTDLASPTVDDLVALHFSNTNEGKVFKRNGDFWVFTSNSWFGPFGQLNTVMNGRLTKMHFADDNMGFAVSDTGEIFYSNDSGTNWTKSTDFSSNSLHQVQNISGIGWVASGEDGTILKSNNLGNSWPEMINDQHQLFNKIVFINSNKAIALIDNKLQYSSNGGQAWSPSNLTDDYVDLIHVGGATGSIAIASNGEIVRSTNDGATWATIGSPSPTVAGMQGIKIWQNNSYLFGANAKLLEYSNLGIWTDLSPSISGNPTLLDAHFPGSSSLCLLAGDGNIYYNSNYTNTVGWTNSNAPFPVIKIYFSSNSTTGFALGNYGEVAQTTDGGQSWVFLTNTINTYGNELLSFFIDAANNGAVVGENGLIWTTQDGGLTWAEKTSQFIPPPLQGVLRHKDDPQIGFVTGQDGTLLRTADGGLSWQIHTTATSKNLNGVDATGLYGVIVGQGGMTLNTGDMGQSWNIVAPNTITTDLLDVAFIRPGRVVAVGADNIRLRSLFNGTNWTSINPLSRPIKLRDVAFNPFPTSPTMRYTTVGDEGTIYEGLYGSIWYPRNNFSPPIIQDAHMVNANVGYAVGNGGTILKTIDGGCSWNEQVSGITTTLHAVHFLDANRGFTVGNQGMVLYTMDGENWSKYATIPNRNLYDIDFTDQYNGMIVGLSGFVIATSNGGLNASSWTPVSTTGSHLFGVDLVTSNYGFAVGSGGKILLMEKSGNTWTVTDKSDISISNTLRSVHFRDYETGYVAGDNGIFLKTVTAGDSWVPKSLNTNEHLRDFDFIDDHNAYISGDDGTLKKLFDFTDEFSSRFYYDRLGRLVVSQNSWQYAKSPTTYSYTQYDAKGRITEVGEIASTDPIEACYDRSVLDDELFQNWIKTGEAQTGPVVTNPLLRTEVTRTFYDIVKFTIPSQQSHLRNRVASTSYEDQYDGDDETYNYASHFSYDIHGNVDTLLQDQPDLAAIGHRYKRLVYTFDLISGNVNEVAYQRGEADQFFHRYEYDADNRLTNVWTSANGTTWDQDAKYFYYQHGPLARTELGHLKVQGCDYAYTIQGWLKGMNSNTLAAERDMGKDGHNDPTNANKLIPKDEVGFTLGYFEGDYSAINSPQGITHFEADLNGSDLEANSSSLYNGNITHMTTGIRQFMQGGTTSPNAMSYTYDQLNRIVKARSHQDANVVGTNTWGLGTESQDYATDYTYDANGNILTLKRNAFDNPDGSHDEKMDDFTYIYENIDNLYDRNTNKLRAVIDNGDNANTTAFDDIKTGQTYDAITPENSNYDYDEIGNLVQDVQEGIDTILWTVYGKVEEVRKVGGDVIHFDYDATGNRIRKIAPNGTTHYIRDPQGNTLTTYFENNDNDTLTYQSAYLFGSSRLGEYRADTVVYPLASTGNGLTHFYGRKQFELSNHLGNVLSTVSDRRIMVDDGSGGIAGFDGEVTGASDYYPFGMGMVGRVISEGYRYGFNGKESDANREFGLTHYDYGFRIYNPGIGKFLSVDPITMKYPTLTPFQFASNSPIAGVDLDGLEFYYAADGSYLGQIGTDATIRVVSKGHMEKTTLSQMKKWIVVANSGTKNAWISDDALYYGSVEISTKIFGAIVDKKRLLDPIADASYGSKTFKGLLNKFSKGKTFNTTTSGVYTDRIGNVNVDPNIDKNGKILGLAWELTNHSNKEKLNSHRRKLNLEKKDWVMGIFKIEAEAFVNRYKVGKELGIKDPMTKLFTQDFKDFGNGDLTEDQLLTKIAEWGYKNAGTTTPSGKNVILREEYGRQYDASQKAKNKK